MKSEREIIGYPGRVPALDEWQDALGRALADTVKPEVLPMNQQRCDLCELPAVGQWDFATGNNAEHEISVALCEGHADEYERLGYDFDEKYAGEILALWEAA